MPWVSVLLRRRVTRRKGDIQRFTDEDVGICKGVGMWHPGLHIVQENLRISQMRQKSYSIVRFSGLCDIYLELAAVMHGKCCLNKIEPYIVGFSLFFDLTNLCFLLSQLDVGRTKRPWSQYNGWWCSCNSFRGTADNGTRSIFANNIPPEEWWEGLPVLPILRRPLSSSSCDWRWSYN